MKKLPPNNNYLIENKLLVSVLRGEGEEPVATCTRPEKGDDWYLFAINERSSAVISRFRLSSEGDNVLFEINIEAVNNSLDELFYRTECPDLYDAGSEQHVE